MCGVRGGVWPDPEPSRARVAAAAFHAPPGAWPNQKRRWNQLVGFTLLRRVLGACEGAYLEYTRDMYVYIYIYICVCVYVSTKRPFHKGCHLVEKEGSGTKCKYYTLGLCFALSTVSKVESFLLTTELVSVRSSESEAHKLEPI